MRDYPALVAAEVTVKGDQKAAASAGFRLPAGYTLETLPKPNDARVTLRPTEPPRLAVLRYSGVVDNKAYARRQPNSTR